MSFPYIADQAFEAGTTAEFDSETDTDSKLNIVHYTTLARHGARLELPFRGAYCAHIDVSGGTADAFLQENDLYDLAADGTLYIRFYFYAKGLVMAASDRFTLFALQSAGPTDEVVVDVRNNAGVIELLAAETGAAATVRATPLVQDQWHCIELGVNLDAGGGNDGTVDFFVDGYQIGAQLGSLDQGAIIQARLGAIGIDAGTTAGHLLFDALVADDTRIFPARTRFGQQRLATKTGHLFLGPGEVQTVTLMAGSAADNALACYDTDEAITDATNLIVPELRNAQGAGDSVVYHVPMGQGYFQRGCYVVLTGTNPRALVAARRATDMGVGMVRSWVKDRARHGVV
jgi:hypothetical protein